MSPFRLRPVRAKGSRTDPRVVPHTLSAPGEPGRFRLIRQTRQQLGTDAPGERDARRESGQGQQERHHGEGSLQRERPARELVRALGELDDKVGRISVPLSYADELYALRNNINLVRRKLEDISA